MVTVGLGGMGGAQPLAGVLAGTAILVVEADPRRVERRLREGYLQRRCADLDEALRLCLDAKERGAALSVGLVGNVAVVLPALVRRGLTPDLVTDQTTTDPVGGYVPAGVDAEQAERMTFVRGTWCAGPARCARRAWSAGCRDGGQRTRGRCARRPSPLAMTALV